MESSCTGNYPNLNRIPPHIIAAYLLASGWHEFTFNCDTDRNFKPPADIAEKLHTIVFSDGGSWVDLDISKRLAIDALAKQHNCSTEEICNKLFSEHMGNYRALLENILANGVPRKDRTGVGTLSLFAPAPLRFDLRNGAFPLLTGRKLHWKSIAHELLWFLRGECTTDYLKENGVTIWDEWAKNGYVGPIYGYQWRNWRGSDRYDQISNVISQLTNDPNTRRAVVSAWNVAELEEMALPPCHYAFQFYRNGNEISCCVVMRSADAFLGLPFNIASYALLTKMIANCVPGCVAREVVISFTGDVHLYINHLDQARELLSREWPSGPQLLIPNPQVSIDDYAFEDFILTNYNPLPRINAPVAV